MANCEPLAWFGAIVLLVTGGFILVPYFRRTGELLSAWTLLLLGVAIFIGLGCFEAAASPIRFRGLQWFEPTKDEVNWYIAASTIFLVTLLVAYYYDPISRALAARSLNRWPPASTPAIFYVLIVCVLVILVGPLLWRVTIIGPVMLKLGHKAIVFVGVFSFILWYRSKLNIVWLMVFLAAFGFMFLLAMLAGGGRRLMLSVILGPIVVIYYARIRHWRPAKGVAITAFAAITLLVVGMMYSSIRHFDRGRFGRERSIANLIDEMKGLGEKDWMQRFASDRLFFFSQQTVHYSLITDRYVSRGDLEPQLLNTLKFLAVYPVPRRLWPEKPRALGLVILRDAVGYPASSWGCGIAGHARYEGGLWVAALYAYLAVIGVRMIDDPLMRQPMNPFLLSILATASTHILAWPRGDLANMTIEIAQCFLFAIILGISGRFLFGTERSLPPARAAMSRIPFVVRAPVR